jgi:Ferritin-like domain
VGTDSSAGGYGRRRGFGRVACFLALALTALALGGCGDSGHGAETNPEKGSDAAVLNEGLSRELTALDAYTRGNGLLRGPERVLGRQLRAQEQEYVDALTKAVRGLGGDTEATAEELDFTQVKDQGAFLTLAYELEGAGLDFYEAVAPRLNTSAPRTLDAALAAGHAQHVVVLRQALGASRAASVPEGFDSGEVPPPGSSGPDGGG